MSRRVTIKLDHALLQRAKVALGTSGISATVDAGLREAVRLGDRKAQTQAKQPGDGDESDAGASRGGS